jgi:hypothetical protein
MGEGLEASGGGTDSHYREWFVLRIRAHCSNPANACLTSI